MYAAMRKTDPKMRELLDCARRVYLKYGTNTDWTEWENLCAAIAAMEQPR